MTSSAFGEWLDHDADEHIDAAIQLELQLNPQDFETAVREAIGDDGQVTAKGTLGAIARRVVADLRCRFDAMHPNAEDARYDRIHAAR